MSMTVEERKKTAAALRAAANVLMGSRYGHPMDPMVVMHEHNKRSRTHVPLISFRLKDSMGGKMTLLAAVDPQGELHYYLRQDWGRSGMPLSREYLGRAGKALPTDARKVPSRKHIRTNEDLEEAITKALTTGGSKIVKVDYEEEDLMDLFP